MPDCWDAMSFSNLTCGPEERVFEFVKGELSPRSRFASDVDTASEAIGVYLCGDGIWPELFCVEVFTMEGWYALVICG